MKRSRISYQKEEPSDSTETKDTTAITINRIRVLCFKMPVGIQLVS